MEHALADVISRNYTVLGWTSHGHTGEDVPLWAYGPGRPVGLLDNTDLANISAQALGFDLREISARLLAEATEVFPHEAIEIDRTDRENPKVRIGPAELPVNKNILRIGGQTHRLEGLVVYIPQTDKVYLPQQAIEIIEGVGK
jgi:alkaline phosphatase